MPEVKEAPKTKGETTLKHPETTAGVTPAARTPGHVTPFERMRRFAEEIDRVFDDFGLGYGRRLPGMLTRAHELLRRETGLIPAEWSPRVDVSERDGQFVVRADLPGLSKDDVKVELTDELLTIRGERKNEKKEQREGYSYSECNYGSFYRAIPLPEGVDSSKASADFHSGVLEVVMPAPRRKEAQARRIEVQEKK